MSLPVPKVPLYEFGKADEQDTIKIKHVLINQQVKPISAYRYTCVCDYWLNYYEHHKIRHFIKYLRTKQHILDVTIFGANAL